MNASNEVSGKDASTAPQNELRLPSSETATTTTAVIRTLMAYCNIRSWRLTLELSGGCRESMIVAQPTRSRPLERIVRHVSHRSRLRLETKNTATKRHVPSQRRHEAIRPWPAPEGAPASTGAGCTLRNNGMILRTLWRAHQEAEQPIAQASLACTRR